MPQRRLIFNADDFGYSKGVNEGIIESHVKGIVTSTSVMVLRKFAYEASSLKKFPKLSIGLHLDMTEPGFQMWKDLSYIFLMKNSEFSNMLISLFFSMRGRPQKYIEPTTPIKTPVTRTTEIASIAPFIKNTKNKCKS